MDTYKLAKKLAHIVYTIGVIKSYKNKTRSNVRLCSSVCIILFVQACSDGGSSQDDQYSTVQYMEELSQLTARWSGIGDDKASYSP